MHIQLIVSLSSIAAAAAVALACDLLRARNFQLRSEVNRLAPSGPKRVRRPTAGPGRAARRRDEIAATEAVQPRNLPIEPDAPLVVEAAVQAAVQVPVQAVVSPIGAFPTGMHSPAVLSEILDSGQTFTGLLISIAVSAKDPRETSLESLTSSTEQLISGLLRSSDFGCRVTDAEFLLLCPGLRASEAQKHLGNVSERLWDYQLRALGKSPLEFNMTVLEVQAEILSDAVASAKQRMSQNRRGAKSDSMNQNSTSPSGITVVPNRKKAV